MREKQRYDDRSEGRKTISTTKVLMIQSSSDRTFVSPVPVSPITLTTQWEWQARGRYNPQTRQARESDQVGGTDVNLNSAQDVWCQGRLHIEQLMLYSTFCQLCEKGTALDRQAFALCKEVHDIYAPFFHYSPIEQHQHPSTLNSPIFLGFLARIMMSLMPRILSCTSHNQIDAFLLSFLGDLSFLGAYQRYLSSLR